MKTHEVLTETGERFIFPIEGYVSRASRITGFRQLLEYGLKAPNPMLVLGHDAFVQWREEGGMTPPVEQAVRTAFRRIRTANPGRGAYIGRAFYVPGIDNPNGPRTAAIYDEDEYIHTIEQFYQFVTDQGYDKTPGADIALILHPFIHVMDERSTYCGKTIKEGEQLPWTGGYIVPAPAPGREHQVRIAATFGPDEAIQSSPYDEYLVDPRRETVFGKTIQFKPYTYVPKTGSVYEPFPIPLDMQLEQALTDTEAIQIAQEAYKIMSRRPNVRIEFITQPDGVYFREIAPWEPLNELGLLRLDKGETVVAPVIRIRNNRDIRRVTGPRAIVYFGPEAFQQRQTDLFAQVAYTPGIEKMVALVHGSVTTSHMARILGDAGHNVILVGDEEFTDGAVYQISQLENGDPMVEALNPYEKSVIPFDDVHSLQKGVAGMKVARLSVMRHYGIPVPDGFGVTSQAVQQYLKDIGLQKNIFALDMLDLTNITALEKLTTTIRKKILTSPLPIELASKIQDTASAYKFPYWATRSSGNEDGGETSSLAGLYESPMNISTENIADMIRHTIASYYSAASIITLKRMGQRPSSMKVGVGIHEFIPIDENTIGAVVFTDQNEIKIEAVLGSPELIVSGHATDFVRILYSRSTLQYTISSIGKPTLDINNMRIEEVIHLVKRIEEIFHRFQDIEMLIVPNRGRVVVQTRPI
ncbi:PEP/pyruvate-binding domain-containing protein [Patescibacteria group bacterium]|nr:PEP/pyruvate-binding domain-containing protein [Patescibacteria group bacterium]MBU1472402.1 PEP/pyruvate-binding domain-containing protein [Patescibacteria group bacterium]MBU2460050.1 PEP/pyruvate-binding domain-containing protein [Patescibacteria group bacterium]